MGQPTKRDAKWGLWQKLIQKFARSTVRMAAPARHGRQAGWQLLANSFNTSTATIFCSRQNSHFRLPDCENTAIALSHTEKRASTLTVTARLMWRGNELGSEFRQCFHRFCILAGGVRRPRYIGAA